MPSPHPGLPLTKHFFFPGYTGATGGLLIEPELPARRGAFRREAVAAFWQALGLEPARPDELRVSLFAYENPALPALLDAWAADARPLTCLVPEGRVLQTGWLYLGRPAQAVRPLSQEELDYFAYQAAGYVRLAADYGTLSSAWPRPARCLWRFRLLVSSERISPAAWMIWLGEKQETLDNQWIVEGPHVMPTVPDPAALDSMPTDPQNGGPYVMWKGTPYAHVMVPVAN